MQLAQTEALREDRELEPPESPLEPSPESPPFALISPQEFSFLRSLSGLSQVELASLLNCGQTTISDYEKGRLRVPKRVIEPVVAEIEARLERYKRIRHIIPPTKEIQR